MSSLSTPTTTPMLDGEAAANAGANFGSVYTEFFPFVWRCLRGLGVAELSLDDASQDVFLVVHRQLPQFAGKSSLRTWIYGIARKVAFNHRRRQQRKARTEPLDQDTESAQPDPLQLAQDGQAARFVQDFLATLSDSKRDVFILAVLEQWSAPEVAEALQVPINTVYSRLRTARLDFQAAVAGLEGVP